MKKILLISNDENIYEIINEHFSLFDYEVELILLLSEIRDTKADAVIYDIDFIEDYTYALNVINKYIDGELIVMINGEDDISKLKDRPEIKLTLCKPINIEELYKKINLIYHTEKASEKLLYALEEMNKLKDVLNATENELQLTYLRLNDVIMLLSKVIEVKDAYTAGHQQRVAEIAVQVAEEVGLSKDQIEAIRVASLIHDIGKIGIPSELLSKPAILEDVEFSLLKNHVVLGYKILKNVIFQYPIAEIVYQHHEREDGTGYPNHLKSEDIMIEAKIIAVADVIEAMMSHRPYRPALSKNELYDYIINKSHLNEEISKIALKIVFKDEINDNI